MSTTFIQEPNRIPYTNAGTTTITSGSGVAFGSILGVAVADIAASAAGVLEISGVHQLAKASGAITAGAQLYWDSDPGDLTTSSTGNIKAGVAFEAATTAATTAKVILNLNV